VNGVAPGLVRTHLAKALWEENEAEIAKFMPLGRIGEPDDIANAIVFLAGDTSSWMTGQTIVIDGGGTIRPTIA
jgi:NAD(P)-dependent dehydrogenase (short-subunit alcohol dehydrogenase family)